jgi:hypothetical protein
MASLWNRIPAGVVEDLAGGAVGVCGVDIDDAQWGDRPIDGTLRVQSVAGAC